MNASARTLFEEIRARGMLLVPELSKINFMLCSLADQEHAESDRQYAHYNHKKHTVCVSESIDELAVEWKAAIIAHELGHAAADLLKLFKDHSEEDANRLGSAILESKITFEGPKRLEWATIPPWLERRLSWLAEQGLSGKRS